MMFFKKTFDVLPPRPAPGFGATRVDFVAPTAAQVASNPPGDALSSAASSLLAYFASNGVPSMHVADPQVQAFQTAWDNDTLSTLGGGASSLDIDGGYGPNTHDALASISGGSAPPVNGAPAPAPAPATPGVPAVPAVPGVPGTPGAQGAPGGVPMWAWWTAGGLAATGVVLIASRSPTGKKVASRAHHHLKRASHHARALVRRRRRA